MGFLGDALGKVTGALGLGGVGQTSFNADPYAVNDYAFVDLNQTGNRKMLDEALAARQGLAAPTMSAAQVQPGQLGTSQVDQSQQAQFRQGQQNLVGALQQQAAGLGGPSAAQTQLRSGLAQAMSAQRAQAASARGLSPGMAQRMASQGMAGLQAQSANDAALLRAQEQQSAQQQLANALSGARGQDVGMAQLGQQNSAFNAGQLNQALSQNASLQQGANQGNLDAALAAQAQKDQMAQYYTGAGLGIDQQQFQAQMAEEQLKANAHMGAQGINAGIAQSNAQAQGNMFGGLLSAGGALAAGAMVSDERAKENIAPADEKVSEFLDELSPKSFDYKPAYGGKDYVGFMAQDAERSALGRALVQNRGGLKTIDNQRLVMALTASAAQLNKRVRQLEGAK